MNSFAHAKRDRRYLPEKFAHLILGLKHEGVRYAGHFRRSDVSVGPGHFELTVMKLETSGTSAIGDEGPDTCTDLVAVAFNNGFVAANIISRDDFDNAEDQVYRWSPAPWGDANAIEHMARELVGVDAISIRQL
jgi:hypothetical protein